LETIAFFHSNRNSDRGTGSEPMITFSAIQILANSAIYYNFAQLFIMFNVVLRAEHGVIE
jgi:hypothetical protein